MPPREEPLNVSFGPGGLPLPQAQPQVPMGLTGLPTGGGMTLPAIPRPGLAEGLFQALEGLGSGWAGQPDPAIERRRAQQAAQAMAMQQQQLGLQQQRAGLDQRRLMLDALDKFAEGWQRLDKMGAAPEQMDQFIASFNQVIGGTSGQQLIDPSLRELMVKQRDVATKAVQAYAGRLFPPEQLGEMVNLWRTDRKAFTDTLDRMATERASQEAETRVAKGEPRNRVLRDVKLKYPFAKIEAPAEPELSAMDAMTEQSKQVATVIAGRPDLTADQKIGLIEALPGKLKGSDFLPAELAGAKAGQERAGRALGGQISIPAAGGRTAQALEADDRHLMAYATQMGQAKAAMTPEGKAEMRTRAEIAAKTRMLAELSSPTSGGPSFLEQMTDIRERSRVMADLMAQPLKGEHLWKAQNLMVAENQLTQTIIPIARQHPEFLGKGFWGDVRKTYEGLERQHKRGAETYAPGALAGAVRQFMGTASEEEIKLRQATLEVLDSMLRVRSGAQTSEQEYDRLKNAFFNIYQEPKVFITNAETTLRTIRQNLLQTAKSATQSALQLRQEYERKLAPSGEQSPGHVPAPGKPPPPGFREK